MRDIGQRIQRYRLSRYAEGSTPRRLLRWLVPLTLAWLVYAGFVSEHSFYRLWRLSSEQHAMQTKLHQRHVEIDRLEAELADPAARRREAERIAREQKGMARPGEIIYRIDARGGVKRAGSAAPATPPSTDGH